MEYRLSKLRIERHRSRGFLGDLFLGRKVEVTYEDRSLTANGQDSMLVYLRNKVVNGLMKEYPEEAPNQINPKDEL